MIWAEIVGADCKVGDFPEGQNATVGLSPGPESRGNSLFLRESLGSRGIRHEGCDRGGNLPFGASHLPHSFP